MADRRCRRLPDRYVLPHACSQVGNHVRRLPDRLRLVHPASQKIRLDPAFAAADEGENFLARLRPLEVAGFIRDKTIERSNRGIDQLGHCVILRPETLIAYLPRASSRINASAAMRPDSPALATPNPGHVVWPAWYNA